MNSFFSAETLPRTVGELHGFAVEIRCQRCGRVAPIEPEKMNTRAGRAIDRHMPLPKFLGALTCTAKACGEKPVHLHIKAAIPPAPGAGTRGRPMLRWMMDRFGRWQFCGEDGEA